MKFEVGDIIEYKGQQFKIAGDDYHSEALRKEWDYWLVPVIGQGNLFVFKRDVENCKVIAPNAS